MAEANVSEMTATDVGSMLYAFYAFRDVLSTIKPSMTDKKAVDGTGGNAMQEQLHVPLVRQLVQRFVEDIEMGTGQDALSVLMGMAVVPYAPSDITQQIIAHHILPQIPIADHEILSHIVWAAGHVKPPNIVEVRDREWRRNTCIEHCRFRSWTLLSSALRVSVVKSTQ